MIVERIISLGIGYVCGMFVSGYLIGKAKHVDLRKQGSGNIGTTNTLRVLGVGYAVITLLCDVFKSILAAILVWVIFHGRIADVNAQNLLMLYGAAGAVLGHDFPCVMKFKGGKGVATTLGLLLAIFPKAFWLEAVVFIGLVALFRYVSLGSILALLTFLAQVIVFGIVGGFYASNPYYLEMTVIVGCLVALSIFLHRSNVVRLLNGTENKISFHSKKANEGE
ncbi:MAG: glycerol-3-phosphate 1-O-acyltransferase PlsY [Lachnospiraceae bacterium]|nr:glycerol-3-phosphate 1-O-acyltransferase PlsY [Lachnospiraceae bacterium]